MRTTILICLHLCLQTLSHSQSSVQALRTAFSSNPENAITQAEDLCAHTSPYYTKNALHLPEPGYTPITIRLNYIFLQNQSGEGNFKEDNPEDQEFIQAFTQRLNDAVGMMIDREYDYCRGGLPFREDAKYRFKPNMIYIQDEKGWNNRNDRAPAGCPGGDAWYLDSLDDAIYANRDIPHGVNIYFSTDGKLYDDMVVQKTVTEFEKHKYLSNHCASEIGSVGDLNPHALRVHLPDAWLKLWWFKNVTGDPPIWLINEFGRSIAHEVGHLMGLSHTGNKYLHCLMRSPSGGNRDYLCPDEVGKIQRVLATNASFWQCIDCGERFDGPGARGNPERVVSSDEIWDLNMRVFMSVRIKAGAELRISCGIQMPPDGLIILEPGARLTLDREGIVTLPESCQDGQVWNGIRIE